MTIFIALILSVVLQLGAALVSVSLIKRTKYNISWIFISIGFSLMAIRRLFDLVLIIHNNNNILHESLFSTWLSVLISLLIFIGTIFIKKIFNLQDRIEQLRKGNEARVFSAIIRTEERERKTFAKELHDGLGPILSAVKMSISAISIKEDETENSIIQKSLYAIDEAIISTKEISNKLSPHILSNYGLDKALQNFIDTIVLNKSLQISIENKCKQSRFEFTIETVIYRILCELIINTLKHANAKKITIHINESNSILTIMYFDNGNGCILNDSELKGMGLSNIKSRIHSIHGNYEIQTMPNEGFKMKIHIPL